MKNAPTILLIGLFMGAYFTANTQGKGLTEHQKADASIAVCQTGPAQAIPVAQESLARQSTNFLTAIFDTQSWPARWNCGTWSPLHGWLYIVSDLIIWLSYFMIPMILGFFVYKKKKEPIPFRLIVFLFIAFILACGLTHLIDAAIFWWPAYRLSALIRLGTAVVSLGTVFALISITPQVLELKSPEVLERMVEERTAALSDLNHRLQEEIKHRQLAEDKLLQLNKQLEEKSKGLAQTNEDLIQREQELKKSEEKVRELNIGLEKKVENRTKELDTINKELEAFTYSVSHDLRAPLRSIHGYTTILSEDYGSKMDDEGRKILNVILKNSLYMGQLIDDLLNFSRTSRVKLMKEHFNADDHVRNIVNDLLTHEKKRIVNIQILPLAPCKADISTLRQVWINLASNALKYTRKNENAKIEVGSYTNNHEVCYYIKDNGVGFDMEYADKLFGVFQRLHKKEDFEGTGVGLALVKRIINRHDGKIWAEAKANEGAAFYFSLPID